MERNCWIMTAAGAAAASLITVGAHAAPMTAATGVASSTVEQIARRCWIQNGVRYCDRSSRTNGSGYRVRNIPEAYPTGSKYWWEEMDRQNRGGRGGRG
jgi:hypothetical protein